MCEYASFLQQYWDWSWDELAALDLPAMLGYVYNLTESKLFYVGHSQASAQLLSRLLYLYDTHSPSEGCLALITPYRTTLMLS
jgi:hypothetical protein